MTLVFSNRGSYKWTVLISLIANVGAVLSYLNYLRSYREGEKGRMKARAMVGELYTYA